MSSGLLAIFTKRIAPQQRGQVIEGWSCLQLWQDVDREHPLQQPRPRMSSGCLVITSSSVAAPSSDNGICVGSALLGSGPGTTLPELNGTQRHIAAPTEVDFASEPRQLSRLTKNRRLSWVCGGWGDGLVHCG